MGITEDRRKNLLELLGELESGMYEQTTGRLRGDDGYCIGGVMCDMSGLGGWQHTSAGWEFRLDIGDETRYLSKIPLVVWHHYGVPERFGRILSIKNDQGKSFRELCEYIRVRIENIYL